MIGPCKDCYFMEIAMGEHVAVMRCIKCGRLRVTCPYCKGVEMRANPKYGYKELTCLSCHHTTNFQNSPHPNQESLW